ncbi:MAG TPA: hypothetical protein VMD52_00020 [Patescibacteria group bacterium]|nr:hypothetical protein [Patescibacteria group bacterium]
MFKRITQKVVYITQKVLISVLLCVVYYVVFGLTVVIAFVCKRDLLRDRQDLRGSTWVDATGYEKDLLSSKMQS